MDTEVRRVTAGLTRRGNACSLHSLRFKGSRMGIVENYK